MEIFAMKNVILIGLVGILILGCGAATPLKYQKDSQSGLTQIKGTSFSQVLFQEQQALTPYNAVMIDDLSFEKFELLKSKKYDVDKSWYFDDRDKNKLSEVFLEAVQKDYRGNKGLAITNSAGPGVLKVHFNLLTLKPFYVKPGSENRVGTFKINNFGAVTVQIILADSQTGKFVGVIQDGQELMGNLATTNSYPNFIYSSKNVFSTLLSELDDFFTQVKTPPAT